MVKGKTIPEIKKDIAKKILQLCTIEKLNINKVASKISIQLGFNKKSILEIIQALEDSEYILIENDFAIITIEGREYLRSLKIELDLTPVKHQDIDEGLTDEEKKILGEK